MKKVASFISLFVLAIIFFSSAIFAQTYIVAIATENNDGTWNIALRHTLFTTADNCGTWTATIPLNDWQSSYLSAETMDMRLIKFAFRGILASFLAAHSDSIKKVNDFRISCEGGMKVKIFYSPGSKKYYIETDGPKEKETEQKIKILSSDIDKK